MRLATNPLNQFENPNNTDMTQFMKKKANLSIASQSVQFGRLYKRIIKNGTCEWLEWPVQFINPNLAISGQAFTNRDHQDSSIIDRRCVEFQ